MDAFMAEIRLMNEQLRSELKQDIQSVKEELHTEIQSVKGDLHTEIQSVKEDLHAEIQSVKEELRKEIQENTAAIQVNSTAIQATNARIDVTNARLEDLYTMVYWGIGLLGLLITLAAVAPYIVKVLQSINIPKPALTLEDVERLIDAKFQGKNA